MEAGKPAELKDKPQRPVGQVTLEETPEPEAEAPAEEVPTEETPEEPAAEPEQTAPEAQA